MQWIKYALDFKYIEVDMYWIYKKSGWIKFQNNKCPEKLRRYSPKKEKKGKKFLSKEKKETQGTKEKKRKKEKKETQEKKEKKRKSGPRVVLEWPQSH